MRVFPKIAFNKKLLSSAIAKLNCHSGSFQNLIHTNLCFHWRLLLDLQSFTDSFSTFRIISQTISTGVSWNTFAIYLGHKLEIESFGLL